MRGKLLGTLEALAAFPCAGHSVLMGRRTNDWQDIQYILGHFGSRLAPARRRYQAFVDQYSRRIVGWAMSAKPDRHLAVTALTMAVARRRPVPALIHHTDQGPQYASQAYRQLLEQCGITPSMSRKGRCADNAMVDSFFSTLKNELIHDQDYRSREEAQAEVFDGGVRDGPR